MNRHPNPRIRTRTLPSALIHLHTHLQNHRLQKTLFRPASTWWAIPMSAGAVMAGCLVSGYILARRIGQNGLFCGLCCGLFFFLIFLLAAMLSGNYEYTAFAAIKCVCYGLAGALGGYIGLLSSERAKRNMRVSR